MAQSVKLSVRCDRCEREEERTVTEDIEGIKARAGAPQFEAKLVLAKGAPLTIKIGDLCTPCANTVAKHLGEIGKKIEGKSPDRGASK